MDMNDHPLRVPGLSDEELETLMLLHLYSLPVAQPNAKPWMDWNAHTRALIALKNQLVARYDVPYQAVDDHVSDWIVRITKSRTTVMLVTWETFMEALDRCARKYSAYDKQ